MKNFYTAILLIFASMLAFSQEALVEEDFDYPVGSFLTEHGWVIQSSGEVNPIQVVTPGLSFEGYVGSGIGNAAGLKNSGETLNKRFTPQTEVGPVYAAFMVNATASVVPDEDGANPRPYFLHFYDPEFHTAHRGRTFIADAEQAGKMRIGLSFNRNAAQAYTEDMLDFETTYLLVLKYELVEGENNDSVSLYIFHEGQDFSVEPDTPTLGPIVASGTQTDIIPTGISLRQFDESQRIVVDGIRVRRDWNFLDPATSVIDRQDKLEATVYPNPVTDGVFYIKGTEDTDTKFDVYDMAGRKVSGGIAGGGAVDVNHLQPGIYVVKISDNGFVSNSRIVIQ